VERLAEEVAARVRGSCAALSPGEAEVLGPAPAPLERLRGRHRHQVLVKAASAPRLAAILRRSAPEALAGAAVRVLVDVDPINML
jgi:primosomal protein N' (replication factor Y)